jgi:hypothetical protein
MSSWSRRLRSLAAALALVGASTAWWAVPAPAVASAPRPIAAASIRLAVEGTEVASFDQLLALTSALDGSPPAAAVRRFSVVLRRPATASLEISGWHLAALRGDESARKDAVLTMHTPDGRTVMRYVLTRAYPSKLELATSDASEVLMETVTITCDQLERAAV